MTRKLFKLANEAKESMDRVERVCDFLNDLKYRVERNYTTKNRKKVDAIVERIDYDIDSLSDLKSVYELAFLKKYIK